MKAVERILKAIVVALLVPAMLAFPCSADASLIGDTISIDWLFPVESTVLGTQDVMVGAEPEVVCESESEPGPLCFFDADPAQFDIDDFSINWSAVNSTFWFQAAFNGFLFRDLDFSTPGRVVAFILSTNIPGIDDSRVSFTDDSIRINLESGDLSDQVADEFFSLRLTVEPVGLAEPGSLALMALGLGVLSGLKRKRRSL